jgi:NitT/TauT family transport system substrate-binding protein
VKPTQLIALCATVLAACFAGSARATDKVSIITSWLAEAEHGGFYQALATGIYAKYGLDVTVRQGGPQLNTGQMLAAGAVDFRIDPNSIGALNFVKNDVPVVAVAAIFQKDPQVLIAHPDVGINTLSDMKGHPIAISRGAVESWWRILAAKYGFEDIQIRPYTFQIGPFLLDKNLVQQGYITSEPFAIEQEGHFSPKVFLLTDSAGYGSYGASIETTKAMVDTRPDLVQHLIDASIEGWYNYLYDDPSPANALIKKDNPDMTDAQIAYSYARMKEYGVVDSGDAKRLGIGAMTDARWQSFFDSAAAVGIVPKDMDFKKAYTLRFVDKEHGMSAAK